MMRQLIPLALSVNTLVLMWMVGNKRILGWVLGLFGQAMWFLFIVVFQAWGLLPLAIGLTFVYTRNLLRWISSEERTMINSTCTKTENECVYDAEDICVVCGYCKTCDIYHDSGQP